MIEIPHAVRRVLVPLSVVAVVLAVSSACASGAVSSPTPSDPASSATATPNSTSSSAPTSTAASPDIPDGDDACQDDQLSYSIERRPDDSGAGSFYWNLVLTNSGSQPCALEGNPTVVMINADTGQPAGNPAEPVVVQDSGTVLLGAGTSAYSLLHLTQAGAHGCPIVPVSSLLVNPPHSDGAPVEVGTPDAIEGCDSDVALFTASSLTPQPLTY